MNLKQDLVSHAVDHNAKFGAACSLNDEPTLQVCHASVCIWVLKYVECPRIMPHDQGPQFSNDECYSISYNAKTETFPFGVERHNAFRSAER